jgi:hypothetical protein
VSAAAVLKHPSQLRREQTPQQTEERQQAAEARLLGESGRRVSRGPAVAREARGSQAERAGWPTEAGIFVFLFVTRPL